MLFTFIAPLSIIQNDHNSFALDKPINFEIEGKEEYSREIPSNEEDQYLSIEVNGKDDSINYIISVFSDSTRTNRIQLGQSFNGKQKYI